jgi:hypothetical protein
MSDKHPGPQKILFWTDKRPLAPDVETRITCAIAEAISAIVGNSALMILVYFIYKFSADRQNINNPVSESFFGFPLVLILVIVALNIALGNYNFKRGSGQNLAFQSGIPLTRTRVSRWTSVLLCSLMALGVSAFVFDMFSGNGRNGFSGSYSVEFLVLGLILGLSAGIATAYERLSWVLDLRAQQGHAIAFEAHPMAAPIVVENDWWKKPKSPSP